MKLFLVATILLCLTALIACDDDAVPSYEAPELAVADEPVAEPAVQVQEELERETLGLIPFWTIGDLAVYQWPGGLWQPEHSYGKQALLFAEGWAQLETGEIWIRLAIQGGGHRGEWVRHGEALLPFSEVRRLQEVEAPEPPIAEVELPGGNSLVVSVLGRSEDRKWIAVRLPGDALAAVFVEPDLLESPTLGPLPVYIGPSIGVWNPMGQADGLLESGALRATARITWYGTPASALPRDHPGTILIHGRGDQEYSVLGRTHDAEWIALRATDFTYGYLWTLSDRLSLNVAIEDVPVIVGARTDVFMFDEDGKLQEPYQWAPYFEYWRWSGDTTIVGSNSEGIWRWDLETDQLTKLWGPEWVAFSPDGKFAAFGVGEGDSWRYGETPRDVIVLPTDGSEPMRFFAVNQRRYTHHDRDPSLSWSPDSRFLLSQFVGGDYVLGIDGSRSDLRSGWGIWLSDSTVAYRLWDETASASIYDPTTRQEWQVSATDALPPTAGDAERIDVPEDLGVALEAEVGRLWRVVDATPSGRWIVVRTWQHPPAGYDQAGFAHFHDVGPSPSGFSWVRIRFSIVDTESGMAGPILFAPGNFCHHGVRAEFSPDGRRLAFSGLVIDCT